jgi:LacI family transcriptional regulator
MSDHYGMGRLAAEHLLDRGLRRLAYFGIKGLWYSQQRHLGFADRAEKAGVPCEVFEVPWNAHDHRTWQNRMVPLIRWLRKLRPPVGLLAVQDYRARAVVDECQRLGLDVPHDVAVMGIDNDSTVCEFCRPTLTSVSRNPWQLGQAAAALLDRLMEGQTPPSDEILVPPEGVVARQSTDTVAVENVHVAAAAHFIHDHLHECFGVESVVRATAISRRQLEVHFRRVLGCTLYDYICRQRCQRAKQLLTAKDRVKFRLLAKACGFSSIEHMRLVFTRLTGITPQQYRRTELTKIPPHTNGISVAARP